MPSENETPEHTAETPAERTERIRQEGETARQQARLTFFMSIFSTVFGLITTIVTSILVPLLLRSYHIETAGKVDETKAKIEAVQQEASEVKKALVETTATNEQRLTAMQHTDLSTAATVAAVKAELTKAQEDMDTAQAAKLRMEEHANATAKQ